MKKSLFAAAEFCILGALAAPQNLVWDNTAGTWKVGGGGWTNSLGEACVFQDGDNVTFNPASNIGFRCDGEFGVGNLIFDNSGDVSIHYMNITNCTSFVKRGTGDVVFWQQRNTFTNDVCVEDGGLQDCTIWTGPESREWSFLGKLFEPHTVYIGTGDTNINYRSRVKIGFNQATYILSLPRETPKINFFVNSGVLDMLNSSYNLKSAIGRTTLKNGGIILKGGNANYPLWINDDVTVERGDLLIPAYILNNNSTGGDVHLSAGEKDVIKFNVGEVTSEDENIDDNRPDLYMSVRISDYTDDEKTTKSSWIKEGKGMLVFHTSKSAPIASAVNIMRDSTYTGNMEIREGTVRIVPNGYYPVQGGNKSFLGDMYVPGRTLTVGTGATLSYGRAQHDTPCLVPNNHPSPLLTTIISNATLRLQADNQLGNLKFYGDSVFLNEVCADNSEEPNTPGVGSKVRSFGFGGLAQFELTKPMLIATNLYAENDSKTRLDSRTDYFFTETPDGESMITNHYGYTEFRVKRVLDRDGRQADVILSGEHTTDHASGHHCGIKKTGDGILELRTQMSYSYLTDVVEGGLYISGANWGTGGKTNIIVRQNGAIGGINNRAVAHDLIIEEGGGFLVDVNNVGAQLNVKGTMYVPAVGHLMLNNVTDPDFSKLKSLSGIKLPKATNRVNAPGFGTEPWSVTVDGFPEKESRCLTAIYDSATDTFSLDYQKTGMVIIVQ